MIFRNWHSQSPSTLLLFAGLTLGGALMASEKQAMMIDVETDSVHIQKLDISHLDPGDTETIYTDDGRVVDVMRKEQGVEIYIDGERLDLPAFTHTPHAAGYQEIHKVVLRSDCDSESDPDCAEEHSGMHDGWAVEEEHDARHIVIIREVVEEEDEI